MKTLLKLIPMFVIVVLVCTSCKPKAKTTTTADPNSSQHNEDVQNTKAESDNSNTDINSALTGTSGFGKNNAAEAISICGATIDSSHQHDATPYLLINFDGSTVCSAPPRTRSGQVKVELITGNAWTDAGAQVRVTYTNYKVTFTTHNNAFVTFNGTKLLTDVNGIDWIAVYLGQSVQLRERTYGMTVTFENGAIASWNSARLSTWAFSATNLGITATVNADSTSPTGKHIDSWGQTRFGTNFTTEMVIPWQSNSICGWWAPTQGEYTSTTDDFTVTAQLGLDGNGNAITSGCASNFRLSWTLTASGTSGSLVLAYL